MGLLIRSLVNTWYIWIIFIAVIIFKLFLPRIKGFFGEKSVALLLSRLILKNTK